MATLVLDKPKSFFPVFTRKPGNQQQTTHYCPGCGHGILHKIIAEAISDLEIQDRCIFMAPVGCSVFLYYYFETAAISVPHGRAPAVSTGISRCRPDAILISYQGDGDLAAIGTNNAIHAANRGERIITIFVNNTVYGMTGGQMAPTTLLGQKTTTSPTGRTLEREGAPLRMAEVVATLDAPVLVARTAVNSPKNIRKTRELIRRGFQAQKEGKGYVFIEVLSPCPVNWRMTPTDACRHIDEVVSKYFPLGVFKDELETREPLPPAPERRGFDALCQALGLEVDAAEEAGAAPPALPRGRDPLRFKGAGFGGQGVLSLGLLVANTAMRKGWEVTWLPSYGPEMRGGVAYSSVVLSAHRIGTPVVDAPDLLVALNRPSLFKLGPTVPPHGVIVYNTSMTEALPEDLAAPAYGVPVSDLAQDLGNIRAANTVALGALARVSGLFTPEEIDPVLRDQFANRKGLVELNQKAIQAGWDYAGRFQS